MIKKVFLDMDGVLVDFMTPACHIVGINPPPDQYEFFGNKEDDVNKACNERFWLELEWMPDGREILDLIEGAFKEDQVFIVSQPMDNADSWTGKRCWIELHIPLYRHRLIITHASKSILASPETLLIDDKDENVDDFIKAGGNAILIPRPWNRLRRHKVIPYLKREINAINELRQDLWEKDASDKEVLDRVKTNIGIRNFHGHPQFYALLDEMAKLHSRKNHDYAGKGNPLRNFYKCKEMGLSPFQGVMVRLSDKWSRLESFMRQGVLEVKNESIKDTLMDNAVYSLLAMILLDEESKDKECPENAHPA